jgi:hypothetical protein
MLNTDFVRVLYIDLTSGQFHTEDRPDLLHDYLDTLCQVPRHPMRRRKRRGASR